MPMEEEWEVECEVVAEQWVVRTNKRANFSAANPLVQSARYSE